MTATDSTPIRDNTQRRTRAEQAAEAYWSGPAQSAPDTPQTAAAGPTVGARPLARPGRPGLLARVKPWLIAGLAGLTIGGAVVGAAAYRVMPIRATRIERTFVDVNGDGRLDLLVWADVVFDSGPKDSALPSAEQP